MATSSPPPNSSTPLSPPIPASSTSPPPSLQAIRPNADPPESSSLSPPPPKTSSSPPSTDPPPPPDSNPSPPSNKSPPPDTSPPPPAETPTPPAESPPPPAETPPPPVETPPPPVETPPSPTSTPPPVEEPPPPPTKTPSSPPPTSPTNPPPPSTESPPPSSPAPPPPVAAPPPKDSPSPPVSTPPPESPPPPSPPVSTPPPESPPPPKSTDSPPPSSSPPPPSPKNSPPPAPPSTDPPSSSPPPPPDEPSPPPPVSPSSPPKGSTPPPPTSPSISPPSPPGSPSTSPSVPTTPSSLLSPPPPISPSSMTPESDTSSPSGNNLSVGAIAAVGVVAGLFALVVVGLVVWCALKRKRKKSEGESGYGAPSTYGSSPASDANLIIKTHSTSPWITSTPGSGSLTPSSQGGYGHSRSWFTYEELFEATKGFADENLLGEGGFGSVFKGTLTDGREVAVKQLKVGGGQGEREFKAEVEIISRIHHRHLVSLVGYCIFESRRLLVYEYVPNQTLYYHLHGKDRPVMNWGTRIKIAVGAARGIAYLHEDCHPRVIHRDIKSSNILLDSNFEARVADFGLAKLAMDIDTHVSTRVMGTFGYMAPEYATSGKLTDKSDVYSFGVVLLELISGRKPVDESQPLGDESLVEWARPLLGYALDTGDPEMLLDPRLEDHYVESEMMLMIEAAAACVRHSATKRPRMGQVVRAFVNLLPSDLSNGMRVGESGMYNSAQQSAEINWFRRMAFGSQDISSDFFDDQSRSTGFSGPDGGRGGGFSTRSQNQSTGFSGPEGGGRFFSAQRSQTRSAGFSGPEGGGGGGGGSFFSTQRSLPQNTGISGPEGGGAVRFFSAQRSHNGSSRQHSQNVYYSSQRSQLQQQPPVFSGESSSGPSSGQHVDTSTSGESLK